MVGALMPTGWRLGRCVVGNPEAVGGLSSVIEYGLAAEAGRYMYFSTTR